MGFGTQGVAGWGQGYLAGNFPADTIKEKVD